MMRGDIAGVSTPKSYYVTQSMCKWLEWFLSLDYVEDEIAQWSDKMSNQSNDKIIDIQQGAAWQQMKWASNENMEGSLRLCFSRFVDWFNPRTNKLAGKQQLMGIVCLACLNLPPEMQNKVENVFLEGIMPGPNAPDMTTVSHLLSPLVDDLLDLVGPPEMKTFKHSQGRKMEVHLLTLIGDTGATHKVGGFASHSAKYYCSWCLGDDTGLSSLTLGPARNGGCTKRQSCEWQKAKKTKRTKLVREHGIWWSELNQLTYRNPVKHTALGYMHNWLKGLLAHHFQERWGFQDVSNVQIQKRRIKIKEK
ncbi:hypothetical protein O181_019721 [Austropuccinia psidii MF-1]|uniref:Uncharacterized protein n=1 Tax=Austropuccinia psidii MF-1 TaxID=1389203 RepID=A0A9Q3CC45_9BASI|nr:hypothetical protein [Austropuccinia psidii MF-1]